MKFSELTLEQMEQEAAALGCSLPIEQTAVWARLEKTIPGKSFWGAFRIERDGRTVAFVSIMDYLTHGYHYLRSVHGPVWVEAPSASDELEMIGALRALVKARDRKPVFCRLAVAADLDECRPTLSTIPYNQTVVVNLTGGQEEIISRMKKRGRRDVRKALRETPATYADETERATASFEEYFQVMVSTAERDGFTPGTCESYESMVRVLGPEHCRVFAGRVDGRLASWAIMNVNGERAVYYYGASRSDIEKRSFVTDGLIIYAATRLSEMGCTSLDMMGVGNDFAPSLKSLNTFKCKFAEGLTDVAPDRDVPLRPVLYASLVKARSLLHARDDKDA